jgi:uncharacterized membrane protein
MKFFKWIDIRTLAKTGSYWVVHVTVAALVAYAVTRDFWAALTLSLLEPTVQAFAYLIHEKVWERNRHMTPHALFAQDCQDTPRAASGTT